MLFKRNSLKYNESKRTGKDILHKQINVGVTVLISDQVDFIKKCTRDRKRYYSEESVNAPKRQSNSKCVCAKQQSWKISEAKTDNYS